MKTSFKGVGDYVLTPEEDEELGRRLDELSEALADIASTESEEEGWLGEEAALAEEESHYLP